MHIADHANGNLGANAIVGGSAGIATGAAFSAKHRGSGQVAVCFFGDGALGQGLLYEVMNMASLWTLPVIYVCENNLYNEYTHYLEVTAGDVLARAPRLRHRGRRGGRPGRARGTRGHRPAGRSGRVRGDGPAFLLCNTYRYHGHHVGDIDRGYYRSAEEEQEWRGQRDPITLLGGWLSEQGIAGEAELQRHNDDVRRLVDNGLAFALDAPFPDVSEVDRHVFA